MQYLIVYKENNDRRSILIEAPSLKAAEYCYLNNKGSGLFLNAREATANECQLGLPAAKMSDVEIQNFKDEFRITDVAELDLSVRSYNCLKKAGITTCGELIGITDADLRSIPNMGDRCYKEILNKLQQYGEKLAEVRTTKLKPGPKQKPSLDSQIRSVAHYVPNETVQKAVLESDSLRMEALNVCENIPGYNWLPRHEAKELYDLVKKSISLSRQKEKGPLFQEH